MKLAFVLFGLALIAFALWSAHMNAAAANWPEAAGVILMSELRADAESESGDSVRIEFEYQAAGQRQRGSTISYVGIPADRAGKQALVDRYPVGREVTVFVDPANPARAVLEREASKAWMGLIAVGVVMIGVGLFFKL